MTQILDDSTPALDAEAAARKAEIDAEITSRKTPGITSNVTANAKG